MVVGNDCFVSGFLVGCWLYGFGGCRLVTGAHRNAHSPDSLILGAVENPETHEWAAQCGLRLGTSGALFTSHHT